MMTTPTTTTAKKKTRTRRLYSDEFKLQLLEELKVPGATQSLVARKYGLTPSTLRTFQLQESILKERISMTSSSQNGSRSSSSRTQLLIFPNSDDDDDYDEDYDNDDNNYNDDGCDDPHHRMQINTDDKVAPPPEGTGTNSPPPPPPTNMPLSSARTKTNGTTKRFTAEFKLQLIDETRISGSSNSSVASKYGLPPSTIIAFKMQEEKLRKMVTVVDVIQMKDNNNDDNHDSNTTPSTMMQMIPTTTTAAITDKEVAVCTINERASASFAAPPPPPPLPPLQGETPTTLKQPPLEFFNNDQHCEDNDEETNSSLHASVSTPQQQQQQLLDDSHPIDTNHLDGASLPKEANQLETLMNEVLPRENMERTNPPKKNHGKRYSTNFKLKLIDETRIPGVTKISVARRYNLANSTLDQFFYQEEKLRRRAATNITKFEDTRDDPVVVIQTNTTSVPDRSNSDDDDDTKQGKPSSERETSSQNKRQRYSVDFKRKLIEETKIPGATVFSVAKQHGLSSSTVYNFLMQSSNYNQSNSSSTSGESSSQQGLDQENGGVTPEGKKGSEDVSNNNNKIRTRATYPVDFKLKLIEETKNPGATVSSVAKKYSLTPSTVRTFKLQESDLKKAKNGNQKYLVHTTPQDDKRKTRKRRLHQDPQEEEKEEGRPNCSNDPLTSSPSSPQQDSNHPSKAASRSIGSKATTSNQEAHEDGGNANTPPKLRKRTTYSVDFKLKLIEETKHPGATVSSVARKYSLTPSTVRTFKLQESELKKAENGNLKYLMKHTTVGKRKANSDDPLVHIDNTTDGRIGSEEQNCVGLLSPSPSSPQQVANHPSKAASRSIGNKATTSNQEAHEEGGNANTPPKLRKRTTYPVDFKLKLIEETKQPGATISSVAKKYSLTPSTVRTFTFQESELQKAKNGKYVYLMKKITVDKGKTRKRRRHQEPQEEGGRICSEGEKSVDPLSPSPSSPMQVSNHSSKAASRFTGNKVPTSNQEAYKEGGNANTPPKFRKRTTYSVDFKLKLIEETKHPGATISSVAKTYSLTPSTVRTFKLQEAELKKASSGNQKYLVHTTPQDDKRKTRKRRLHQETQEDGGNGDTSKKLRKRTTYPVDFKLKLIEETKLPGATVLSVARKYSLAPSTVDTFKLQESDLKKARGGGKYLTKKAYVDKQKANIDEALAHTHNTTDRMIGSEEEKSADPLRTSPSSPQQDSNKPVHSDRVTQKELTSKATSRSVGNTLAISNQEAHEEGGNANAPRKFRKRTTYPVDFKLKLIEETKHPGATVSSVARKYFLTPSTVRTFKLQESELKKAENGNLKYLMKNTIVDKRKANSDDPLVHIDNTTDGKIGSEEQKSIDPLSPSPSSPQRDSNHQSKATSCSIGSKATTSNQVAHEEGGNANTPPKLRKRTTYPVDFKLKLIEETKQPGATISSVAKKYSLTPSTVRTFTFQESELQKAKNGKYVYLMKKITVDKGKTRKRRLHQDPQEEGGRIGSEEQKGVDPLSSSPSSRQQDSNHPSKAASHSIGSKTITSNQEAHEEGGNANTPLKLRKRTTYSVDFKLKLIEETKHPGATLSSVAKKYSLTPSTVRTFKLQESELKKADNGNLKYLMKNTTVDRRKTKKRQLHSMIPTVQPPPEHPHCNLPAGKPLSPPVFILPKSRT